MKSKPVALLVSWIAVAIVWLLKSTLRFRYHGQQHLKNAESKGGYIYSFWHQHIIGCTIGQGNGGHVVMASRSRSADPMVAIASSLGHTMVRGSSSKGGRDKGGQAAKQEIIALLQAGMNGAMAADGPQGPPRVAKLGIADMAAETGHSIVPLSAAASRYWEFNSWDKIRLPKPFSTIDIYFGESFTVPANSSKEEKLAILEKVSQATSALEPQTK